MNPGWDDFHLSIRPTQDLDKSIDNSTEPCHNTQIGTTPPSRLAH